MISLLALLFWFDGDFRCGVPLFIIILVIYKIEIGKDSCLMLDEQVTTVWEIAVHLPVAGDVFDGVFLCCPFSHEMSWMRSGT